MVQTLMVSNLARSSKSQLQVNELYTVKISVPQIDSKSNGSAVQTAELVAALPISGAIIDES